MAGDRPRSRLPLVTAIAALGGFLFGYDTGVISDALLYIAPAFGLGDTGQQVVVSALLLGALVGALLGGRFADGIGRKRALVGAAVVFAVAAVVAALAPGVEVLIGARVLLGSRSVCRARSSRSTSPRSRRRRAGAGWCR